MQKGLDYVCDANYYYTFVLLLLNTVATFILNLN